MLLQFSAYSPFFEFVICFGRGSLGVVGRWSMVDGFVLDVALWGLSVLPFNLSTFIAKFSLVDDELLLVHLTRLRACLLLGSRPPSPLCYGHAYRTEQHGKS